MTHLKKIKVAVIGAGNMGKHHARNYSNLPNTQLVAICDSNPDTAKSIADLYQVKAYSDYNKMLDHEDLDAVSIAAPTSLHYKIATDCLNKKLHILVEKPLALTIKQAQKLALLAKKNKRILLTGHIEQYNPAIIKLKQLIHDGILGKILSINVKRVGLFPPQINDVNVVTDIAVHDLDIVKTITQNFPKSIYAKGSGGLTNGREDHVEIFLDYDDFGCFIQANWITPIKIREISVTGTKGYINVNYISQEVQLYKSNYKKLEHRGFNEYLIQFGQPKYKNISINKQEPLKLELINFINSIRKKTKPEISPQQAIDAIYLTQVTNKSIRTNKVIKIKH